MQIIHRCAVDLPAVAARIEVDRSYAYEHRIEDVLRRVMFRVLVQEKSGWNNQVSPPSVPSRSPPASTQ
ncbi:MAG: hypothetical protein NTW33_07130 [Methanoregula sp.]|nr:hypothetical protein [Methanoregula sp.]